MNYSDPFGLCTPQWVCNAWNTAVANGKQFIADTKAEIDRHGGGLSGFNAMMREGLQGGSPARNLLMAGTAATAAGVGPSGAGPNQAVVGASETRVSRWMSEAEYKAMKSTGTLQTDGRTFVTMPGAPKPGGVGPVRVDFNAPTDALKGAGREDWRVIYDPGRTPITGIERVTPP